MAESLILNETELLLLQQRMDGNVSGLGYSLETAGVETADYRGREHEDIFSAGPVQEADRTGWINKIKFYVNDPNSSDDRTVLLHIYRDGHVRCEKHVVPSLLADVKDHIVIIRQYTEYLYPLNELINHFSSDYFEGKPTYTESKFIRNLNDEFEEVISENFDTTTFREKEGRMYISIIANIGLALCEDGVPDADNYLAVPSVSSDRLDVEDENIEKFFKRYSYYVNRSSDIDYSELVNHLRYLLGQSWDDPLEVVEHSIDLYDL